MISYEMIKEPKYSHDCNDCKYLFTICDNRENYVDVYKQCDSVVSPDSLLLRYGPNGADYVSSVTMESLVMGYMMSHFNVWKDR